jgi:hypothetical protein
MSFWSRLVDAFRAPGRPEDGAAPDAAPTVTAEEAYLRHLLNRPSPAPEGAQGEIGDREFWAAITRLTSTGKERTAIELLGRFVAARPDDPELIARLCELLCERREDQPARALLEKLTKSPSHALRAHFLIADIAERAGDDAAARRHLESVLAVDLDYPRARARADKLARPVASSQPVEAPTVLSASGQSTGRYRLLRELGRGASGAVYLARDEELDRPIALKILHPGHHQKGAEARARAWLEARLAASIRHPGVVAIYDLDEEHHLVAMELCDGGTLRERLARGALPLDEALGRAAELCRTLASVHLHGIAHGDLKPGNLLFRSENGELVIVDFGLARLVGDNQNDGARGTLAYMAPEQRQGQITPKGDVFAAGVISVELLFGSAALSSWLGDRARLLRGEARWSGALPQGLLAREEPLRRLLSAMMTSDPAARPSAADAARAFGAL